MTGVVAATRRSVSPALLLVGLAALACGEASPGGRPAPTGDAPLTPREWTEGEGFRWRELAIPPSGRAGFRALEPDRTGVAFENRLTEESLVENQMRTNGSGVALADVDGDGRVDIYLARLDGPNALYRNLGDWRFEDVTASAGVEAADRFSTGATFADVDGDGDPDLLLTALGGGVTLFVNDGRGAFEPRTDAGLESDAGSMSMALADIDGDGDLDLYVTNYKRASVLDLYPPEARDFASTVRRTDTGYEVVPEFAPHYELQWRGNEVRRLEKAEPDRLYRNLGDGRFQAVAFGEAFRDPEGVPVDPAPGEWGLAARFGDLDGDGDADLYVCNDLHSPDRLWLNDGQGGFREIDPLALRTTSASTMAVDFSDIERDGDVDIFTLDMWARSSRRQKTQDPVARVERALPGEVGGTQQVPHNALQVNRGDGTWAEIANQAGVEASGWSWSALFVDVDLDGFEDLLIPNGHIRDLMDADTQRRIRTTAPRDWRRNLLLFDPLPLVNVAFHNLGGRRFEEVGVAWGFGRDPDVSHGGALADLDGDGDLDVVVNRLGSPALLLRNETAAPRVAVRLRGRPPNTRGIGATISVRAAGLPEQTKELAAGGGYLSSSEPLAVFALGGAGGAEIEVRWPSGRHSRVRVEGPNRLIEVDESGADTLGAGAGAGPGPGADGAGAGADGAGSGASGAAPWFEPVGSFTALHDEPPFDDFARQPLLPMRLSQSGPALAWRDLDADGDPDLAIGQGAGSPPGLYRNDGGRLRRVTVPGPEAPVDQTGIAGLPGPRGGGRLALGWSSWEAPAADVSAVPGAVTFDVSPGSLAGATVVPAVRGLPGGEGSATGPLAAADVDGDGILDLFVGGRARPGRYPEPASSRLLRGTPSGDLQPDPVHQRPRGVRADGHRPGQRLRRRGRGGRHAFGAGGNARRSDRPALPRHDGRHQHSRGGRRSAALQLLA